MAHKEGVRDGDVEWFLDGKKFFWNVSSNVGYGYANKTADVLLIQFLLNCYTNEFKTLYNKEPLETDGIFGGKTWARIKFYQKELWKAVADGMVSSTDGFSLYTPKQKQIYTIYFLCRSYLLSKPTYYVDLRLDPECPPLLRSILSGPMPDLG